MYWCVCVCTTTLLLLLLLSCLGRSAKHTWGIGPREQIQETRAGDEFETTTWRFAAQYPNSSNLRNVVYNDVEGSVSLEYQVFNNYRI